MEELAKLYDLEEAEELSMSTIETRNAQFSENHPNTLTSIGKFAGAYRKQGRLEEAEQLAMQVMETHNIVSGKVHPDTLLSVRDVAIIWKLSGKIADATHLIRNRLPSQGRTGPGIQLL